MTAFLGGRLLAAPLRARRAVPQSARPLLAPIALRGLGYGGARTLAGDTETQTGAAAFVMQPFSRVLVHDLATGLLIAETLSDAAGNFSVPHLARREYIVTGIDRTGAFDPASTIRISA
jgi:hypothetical protein